MAMSIKEMISDLVQAEAHILSLESDLRFHDIRWPVPECYKDDPERLGTPAGEACIPIALQNIREVRRKLIVLAGTKPDWRILDTFGDDWDKV